MKAAARLVKEAIVHRRYERALEDESAYAIISVWDYIKVSRLGASVLSFPPILQIVSAFLKISLTLDSK